MQIDAVETGEGNHDGHDLALPVAWTGSSHRHNKGVAWECPYRHLSHSLLQYLRLTNQIKLVDGVPSFVVDLFVPAFRAGLADVGSPSKVP